MLLKAVSLLLCNLCGFKLRSTSFAALKCGADLSFIACSTVAAQAIKAYSPELIVHGVLPADNQSLHGTSSVEVQNDGGASVIWDVSATAVKKLLLRKSAVVLGPGLGRSKPTMHVLKAIFPELSRVGELGSALPTVVDADGLWFVGEHLPLLFGARHVVLTPNVAELALLQEKVNLHAPLKTRMDRATAWFASPEAALQALPGNTGAAALSYALGGVAILAKGVVDTAAIAVEGQNGTVVVHWDEVGSSGSPRRCGGQGDVMAGALGTFLGWAHMRPNIDRSGWEHIDSPLEPERLLGAMAGASELTRRAAKLAFAASGRSTTTPDILTHIGAAFFELFNGSTS
jgi:ATP-dependent NAD(P)H-hydrate dehydratase